MTTSSIQRPPEQVEQRPQPDVNKQAEPVAPPKRRMMVVASAVILIVAGIIIWRVFFATPSLPDSIVAVSGRIEGDDSAVASKTTGHILEVRVREGDVVNAGDTIAILDDDQIRARENQARATLLEAEAKAKGAQEQIAVLQEHGKPKPSWLPRNPTWRSRRPPIRSPRSIKTLTRASRNPARFRSAKDCRLQRLPISRPPQ